MRQTLWAEQIIKNKVKGLEADDYLHLHIIPDKNADLLDKPYNKCGGKGMKDTWKTCLTNPTKYMVISPDVLWRKQQTNTDHYRDLQERYG
jgi:hypothetical protein